MYYMFTWRGHVQDNQHRIYTLMHNALIFASLSVSGCVVHVYELYFVLVQVQVIEVVVFA